MALISQADQDKLRQDFAAMPGRVKLLFFTQTIGCDTCLQTRRVLDTLAEMTDKVAIEEANLILDPDQALKYGVDRAPAIAVVGLDEAGEARDSGIRFLGAPAGYEFISLVQAVLLVGGRGTTLSDNSLRRLATVDRAVTIRVFTTPTCSYCPRAVVLAHEMAFASPFITAYAVEATEFPDLARRYRVTGVPKTSVDDRIEILGALPEEDFVAQVLADVGLESAAASPDYRP
jgi:glutaredoxin-like protein